MLHFFRDNDKNSSVYQIYFHVQIVTYVYNNASNTNKSQAHYCIAKVIYMNDSHTLIDESESQVRRGSGRLVVGLLIFVGAFYLMVNSMMEGGAYFLTIDEVHEAYQKGHLKPGRKVRIKGNVAHGSYQNQTGSSEHRFIVAGESNQVFLR